MAINTTGIEGLYDTLMAKAKVTLDEQYSLQRMESPDYAMVVSNTISTVLQLSVSAIQKQEMNESQISRNNVMLDIETRSADSKVALAQAQADKMVADKDYVLEKKTQLINSVVFNNKIKSADSLADVYGTVGASGSTVSSDMWMVLFNIIADLAGVEAPTSTTVTKVT